MNVTKAIILVAGFGTRRLPITKAVEKCMLPIGNRPLIDYVVEDCIEAGIKEVFFVVGENFEQLKTYYGRHELLEEYLGAKGKTNELQYIVDLSKKAKFHYIIQDQHQHRGTTVTLWLCKDVIAPGEQFLFIAGDQFYFNQAGESEAANFLNAAEKSGAESAMLVTEVPHEEVYKYGVVKLRVEDGKELFDGIVEKPSVEDAPSNLNNCTFWLFNDSIFKYAERDIKRPHTGEYQVTDVANEYATDGHSLAVIRAKGEYLDGGSVEGWLHANNRVLGK